MGTVGVEPGIDGKCFAEGGSRLTDQVAVNIEVVGKDVLGCGGPGDDFGQAREKCATWNVRNGDSYRRGIRHVALERHPVEAIWGVRVI